MYGPSGSLPACASARAVLHAARCVQRIPSVVRFERWIKVGLGLKQPSHNFNAAFQARNHTGSLVTDIIVIDVCFGINQSAHGARILRTVQCSLVPAIIRVHVRTSQEQKLHHAWTSACCCGQMEQTSAPFASLFVAAPRMVRAEIFLYVP